MQSTSELNSRVMIMDLPPATVKSVKEDLKVLCAPKEIQLAMWSDKTDFYSSYIETVCGVFDDSGFTFAVETDEAIRLWGAELTTLLLRIGELVDKIDAYMNPVELVNLPEMEEIRPLAQEALKTPLMLSP